MARIELKPCPCCGSKPEMFIDRGFYETFKIRCSDPFCIIHSIEADYASINDAINSWNRRAVITEGSINDQDRERTYIWF